MQFNEALVYLQNQIATLSSDELDPIILRAMFEDLVVERASEYFEDVGEEVLPDSTDWGKMEELLQSKIPNYAQFVQEAAEAFLAEYRADTEQDA
jgi:hypothetical protein